MIEQTIDLAAQVVRLIEADPELELCNLTHLKLTLLNPLTTIEHVQTILRRVKWLGREVEQVKERGCIGDVDIGQGAQLKLEPPVSIISLLTCQASVLISVNSAASL